MKPTAHHVLALCLTAWVPLCGTRLTAQAGSASKPVAATPPSGAKPDPTSIPRSIFEIPKTAKEGRDPFFPNSARPYGTAVTRTNPVPAVLNLALKALSGPPTHRLATINNVTFAVGEENEVLAGTTRVRVRLLEIKDDAVEIEAAGIRRTLRMRSGF